MLQFRAGLLVVVFLVSLCINSTIADDTDSTPAVLDQVKKSVVVIEVLNKFGDKIAQGSGFAVAKGIVATNVHVLKDGHRFRVVRSDKRDAVITGIRSFDPDHDIALVELSEVDGDGNIPPLKLADDAAVQVGTNMFVIGHPKGFEFSVTRGIISSVDRRLPDKSDALQSDAATDAGSSGGPWVNESGQVVGIHRAGYAKKQGFNFAAHVKYLRKLMIQKHNKSLPRDHFAKKNQLGKAWQVLFPVSPARLEAGKIPFEFLKSLKFDGSKADYGGRIKYNANDLAHRQQFVIDGEWGIKGNSLLRTKGSQAAIGLASNAAEFELEGVMSVGRLGAWFILVGWDGENGYAFYHLRVRNSAQWRTVEIKDGKTVNESLLSHNVGFRPSKPHKILLRVVDGRMTVIIDDGNRVADRVKMPNYSKGAVILGTYPTIYGATDISVHALRIRAK